MKRNGNGFRFREGSSHPDERERTFSDRQPDRTRRRPPYGQQSRPSYGPSRPPRDGGDHRRSSSPSPSMSRSYQQYIPAHRLQEGIPSAQRAVAELMESFGQSISGDYDLSSLEVSVSFDENGRFIGFGRGGVASIQLTLSPLDTEHLIECPDEVVHAAENHKSDVNTDEDLDLSDEFHHDKTLS